MFNEVNLEIEPALAKKYGDIITKQAVAYNTEIDNIYNIIDELKISWQGTAAQRFTDGIEEFREDYKHFGDLIDEVGTTLVSIGKDYENLEEDL